jgi:hypothetical protein
MILREFWRCQAGFLGGNRERRAKYTLVCRSGGALPPAPEEKWPSTGEDRGNGGFFNFQTV